jgi:hypothetical protein
MIAVAWRIAAPVHPRRPEMRRETPQYAALLLLALPLLLAACASEPTASKAAVDSAVSTADQSKTEADKALQTAQKAEQDAQKAEQDAQAADQRADKMYNHSLRK